MPIVAEPTWATESDPPQPAARAAAASPAIAARPAPDAAWSIRGGMLRRVHSAALIVNPFSSQVTEPRLEAVERALAPYAELETISDRPPRARDRPAREVANSHDAAPASQETAFSTKW